MNNPLREIIALHIGEKSFTVNCAQKKDNGIAFTFEFEQDFKASLFSFEDFTGLIKVLNQIQHIQKIKITLSPFYFDTHIFHLPADSSPKEKNNYLKRQINSSKKNFFYFNQFEKCQEEILCYSLSISPSFLQNILRSIKTLKKKLLGILGLPFFLVQCLPNSDHPQLILLQENNQLYLGLIKNTLLQFWHKASQKIENIKEFVSNHFPNFFTFEKIWVDQGLKNFATENILEIPSAFLSDIIPDKKFKSNNSFYTHLLIKKEFQ